MKIAYADCFSGISGDMLLAALVDAGLPLAALQDGINQLGLPEPINLRHAEVHKGALRASSVEVIAPHSHHHRHLSDILEMISASQLPERVKQTASQVFILLAQAEARVHGETVEKIHFHEVGALDSIADVIGAALGLEMLGIERLYASPLPYGCGSIESAHGILPLPAPATLEVLKLAQAPLSPSAAKVELVTPTGAAILGCLATFSRPEMTLQAVGVGAGKRDLDWPNLMRLMIGEATEGEPMKMVQIETNIDDMNPQFYGLLMEKLFTLGAVDVFMSPIQMKKNRPGTILGVIAPQHLEAALAELILKESTTFGLRVHPIYRYEAEREFTHIQTAYGELQFKQKMLSGQVIQSVPEYEDCARLAEENNVSLAQIYQAAYRAINST